MPQRTPDSLRNCPNRPLLPHFFAASRQPSSNVTNYPAVLGSFKSELKIYAVYEEQKYKSYSLGPDFYGAARPASRAKNKAFGSAAAG
jgi:hypothetical protein